MLLAQAQSFWKSPTVYDVFGLAGFAVGIGSIWLAWWLAKRDINQRIDEATDRASRAARDDIRRVARAVFHSGVAEALRTFALVREVCRYKKWARAGELCELAEGQLARVTAQPTADAEVRADLRDVSAVLREAARWFGAPPKGGTGDLPDGLAERLSGAALALHRIEGRMTAISEEVEDGRPRP